MLKIIAIPILLTLIASGCDASRIALKLNRTHHLLDVLPITHTDRTEKTKIICLEEPDHKEYAKTARYIVHKSGKQLWKRKNLQKKIEKKPCVYFKNFRLDCIGYNIIITENQRLSHGERCFCSR